MTIAPASARRPIVFDITHLVSRLPELASTGIDRVDLAYAAHFAGPGGMAAGLHYGLRRPHLFSVDEARKLVRLSESVWASETGGAGSHPGSAFASVMNWLATPPSPDLQKPRRPADATHASRPYRRLQRSMARVANNASLSVPDRAIYLNVAQHLFEYPLFFGWLKRRDDLCNVFMIHDLLSLDYPEFFRPANLGIFQRRLATALLHASAFVVSTHAVKQRLENEIRRQALRQRPIHVQPFPSPLEDLAHTAIRQDRHREERSDAAIQDEPSCPSSPGSLRFARDDGLAKSGHAPALASHGGEVWLGHPYFVMLATIEPRKNHLLLLHVWRDLVARDPHAPRLVMVGARGWETEQVADILDRSAALCGHVLELRGLPSLDLVDLIRGARAVLMPSFDEGYGLPLVEALSLGTPVVASDIAVFHEVTQERATFLSPLNGEAWRDTIRRLTNDEDYALARRAEAGKFEAPTWASYFAGLDRFLSGL
jgi:glycosyltransferase involved in cell wall biosynthesis